MILDYSGKSRNTDPASSNDAYWSSDQSDAIDAKNIIRGSFYQKHLVLAISDGLKGEGVGTRTIELFKQAYGKLDNPASMDEHEVKNQLKDLFITVHSQLRAQASDEALSSTLTVVWFTEKTVIYGHVGNSRVYRFQDNLLQLLTEDHTEVWDMVMEGKITPEKAREYPSRHNLTQTIGQHGAIKPQIDLLKIESNDVFMLCTAGFTEEMPDSRIQARLLDWCDHNGSMNHEAAAGDMVDLASEHTATKDASVLLCQVQQSRSSWTPVIHRLLRETGDAQVA